jgi:hypothetical protein
MVLGSLIASFSALKIFDFDWLFLGLELATYGSISGNKI